MTDSTQARLGEDTNSSTGTSAQPVAVARAAKITDLGADPNELPGDYSRFGPPRTEHPYSVETRRFMSGFSSQEANATVSPSDIRWVTSGDLAGYVEEYGEEVRSVPKTYSSFGEWEEYVGKVDNNGDQYAWGVTQNAVEKALRVLSGGGRYQASRYTVILCGEHPFILTGAKGTLLCSTVPIKTKGSISAELNTVSVGGQEIGVAEENETVLAGIKRLVTFLSSHGAADINYKKCSGSSRGAGSSYHIFEVKPCSSTPETDPLSLLDAEEDEPDPIKLRANIDDLFTIGNATVKQAAVREQAADKFNVDNALSFPGDRHSQTDYGYIIGWRFVDETPPESPAHRQAIETVYLNPGELNSRYASCLETTTEYQEITPTKAEKVKETNW